MYTNLLLGLPNQPPPLRRRRFYIYVVYEYICSVLGTNLLCIYRISEINRRRQCPKVRTRARARARTHTHTHTNAHTRTHTHTQSTDDMALAKPLYIALGLTKLMYMRIHLRTYMSLVSAIYRGLVGAQ